MTNSTEESDNGINYPVIHNPYTVNNGFSNIDFNVYITIKINF